MQEIYRLADLVTHTASMAITGSLYKSKFRGVSN